MKLKEKTFTIDYDKYSYRLTVVMTTDVSESRKKRDSLIGGSMDGTAHALHSYNEEMRDAWIILPYNVKVDTIAHEAFHAVVSLFSSIGSVLDDSSEEIYAYELSYIVNQIVKFIKQNKKKFKR